jgi:hypothetical protein
MSAAQWPIDAGGSLTHKTSTYVFLPPAAGRAYWRACRLAETHPSKHNERTDNNRIGRTNGNHAHLAVPAGKISRRGNDYGQYSQNDNGFVRAGSQAD